MTACHSPPAKVKEPMSTYKDFSQAIRIVFLCIAVVIITASTLFSNRLARELANEERKKMELWAEAIRFLIQEPADGQSDMQFDYSLTLKIIEGNTNIPVILTDQDNNILSHSNLNLSTKHPDEDLAELSSELIERGQCIEVRLAPDLVQYVYYSDSRHLKMLKYFPYVQLAVMFVFFIIVIISLTTSKKAEQNKVWVGLSKETAHQLGTPISSLLAWEEILKMKDIDPSLLSEIQRDTQRLQTIAERFSKIGSKPEPKPEALGPAIDNAVRYIKGRSSKKVSFTTGLPDNDVVVPLNIPLFEWVIENLCKNAIDAMDGNGSINISVADAPDCVTIDVSDTGKGIAKNRFKTVFKPGYTTKARGWGLGLSLVKRIVEEYHHGKIFVKSSELGKGTTFRILLKK